MASPTHELPPAEGSKISVVVPCFNSATTVQRALASVFTQRELPREVLCVDDASTDATVRIIEAAARSAPIPVRVIGLTSNGGPAHARNTAIHEATGKWIAMLDSDDAWHVDKLAVQCTIARACGADLVGGQSVQLKEWPAAQATAPLGAAALATHRVTLQSAVWRNPFATSSVLVRRAPVLAFPEGGLAEDFALWLSLMRDGWGAVRHGPGLAFRFKPAFGATGLSARLWEMERGELQALAIGCQGRPWLLPPAAAFSLAKHLLRLSRRT